MKNFYITELLKKHHFLSGFLVFLMVLILQPAKAQVTITPATTVSNVCINGGYRTLTDIEIKETVIASFAGVGQTYVLSPPTDFEFKPGTGTVTKPLITDLSFVGVSVTASEVTIFYNAAAVPAVIDSLILSGLEIRCTGGTPTTADITQTSGFPVSVDNHGTVTSMIPTVTFSALSDVCLNTPSFALSGGLPAGGTYSGPGVSGNNFYPSVAGAGTHVITYEYTDGNGCSASNTTNIVVHPLTTVTLAALASPHCENTAAFALSGGLPVGGTYSGAGVSGGNFDPSLASIGTNVITYSHTDGNGCTNTATRNIVVNAKPTVTFAALADRCVSASSFALSGGAPVSGTYSGTGVSGTNFNPGTAGEGTHTLTYTYTDGNGCTNLATSNITVHALPGVTFSGLNTTYCVNAAVQGLTGFPGGGTFTGSGISGTNFNPSTAGVGGPYTITYTYTDGNGCTNSATDQVSVLSIPSVTLTGLDNAYSVSDNYDDITGTQSPAGGTVTVSGPGVSNFSGRFYPSVAGLGTHTISRNYVAPNGCSVTATKQVTVTDNSGGNINGLSSSYCIDAPIANLTGSPTPGFFTGPGITNTGGANSGTATFNPAAAGVGTHQIVYWFVINFFGMDLQIPLPAFTTVHPLPFTLGYGLNSTYCIDAPTDNLFGYPGGGSFNGPGVSGSTFSPASAGVGNKTITYSYTDPSTTCSNTSDQFTTVNPSPTGVDFSGLATQYCEDASPATLTGTPSGGVFTGNGINGGNLFTPSFAVAQSGSGSKAIVYTYTNVNGCSATRTRNTTVDLLPVVSFSGFPATAKYCVDAPNVTLTGSPSGGTFTTEAPVSPPGTISGNIFSPSTGGVRDHYILYSYTDGNGCTNYKRDTATVNALPFVDFGGLDAAYCHVIGQSVPLTGNQPVGPTAIFSGPGIAGSSFLPAIAGVGQHTIQYQFTDANGCYHDTTKSTIVYARPQANYTMSSLCEGDTIQFDDQSTVLSTAQAPSTINFWQWRYSDGITFQVEDTARTFTYGSYTLWLDVSTNRGCDTTLITNFIIGPYPKPDYSWRYVCDQDVTEFTNLSTILAGSITNYDWDFDDAAATSNSANTTHQFTGPGVYDVVLTTTSDKNCVKSKTQKAFVLPVKNAYPYFVDFESGDDGWVASSIFDTSATWALGTPVKSVINTASSGANAWVTGLNADHKQEEKSYVYSPCFDFSTLTKPMVSMDINSASVHGNAGAVVQFSLDDGQTWEVIGENIAPGEGDGLNWYNDEDIDGQVGIQVQNQDGWTGDFTNGWKTARHNLNGITSNKVRFRMAFGSDGSSSDGFAFDDFWIGERQKLVLLEHFTNSSSMNTAMENDHVNNVVNLKSNDIVAVHYHTDFPGADPMNQRNSADPSARVLFYGVSQIPRSVLDGNFYSGNSLGVTESTIDIRSLEDPEFLINLTSSLNPTSLAVSADVTAQENISNNVTVYLAVVERNVTAVTGSNGETTFEWVLTKLMPDGAGTSFTQPWITGDMQTVSHEWFFGPSDIYDSNELGIVAFVQDNVTKEVYQAEYLGTGGPIGTPPLAISKKDKELLGITVYPNPTASQAYVMFEKAIESSFDYNVYDQLGKVVAKGQGKKGDEGFVLNSEDLANGIYTIKIGNEEIGVAYKKLVIAH